MSEPVETEANTRKVPLMYVLASSTHTHTQTLFAFPFPVIRETKVPSVSILRHEYIVPTCYRSIRTFSPRGDDLCDQKNKLSTDNSETLTAGKISGIDAYSAESLTTLFSSVVCCQLWELCHQTQQQQ